MPDAQRPRKPTMSDMVPVSRPKKVAKREEPTPVKKKVQPVVSDRLSERPEQDSAPKKMGCAVWLIAIVCAVILVLVIGGLFAEATVSIKPKSFSGAVDATVTLSQMPAPNTLQFYTATKVFSDDRVVPSVASNDVDTFATGTVRFYNAAATAKTLPARTVIQGADANGTMISFDVKTAATIPAAKAGKPGQRDLTVTAMAPGSDSNIGLSDFVLSVPVTGITAHSVTVMSGGALGTDKVADPTALAAAEADLSQSTPATADLVARVTPELPSTMVPLGIAFVDPPVVTTDPTFADGVHVISSVTVAITMIRRTDLAQFLATQIGAPKGLQLTVDTLDGLSITSAALATATVVPPDLSVRMSGNATVVGSIDTAAISAGVQGISRGQASALIRAIPEVDSFTIHMMPFWRNIFPTDPNKITVTVAH